ncbi:hypothetical protein Tco_1013458 [Tanacetum coccineum]
MSSMDRDQCLTFVADLLFYNSSFLDMAYGSRVIRRIGNWSNALSCEVQALIHHSFDVEVDFGKTRDYPYLRSFDEYKEEFDNEIELLANEYDLRVGRKRYALDDVWEKCEKFHDTSYSWHDEGFEEEEQWESGIEKTDYKTQFVKSETFEVKRYYFKNGKSFVCITKQLDDALPLGRVNGSRFMEMIRKEMDEEGRIIRKT